MLKNFGILSEEAIESVGMNAKMNEFQAAMGLCNLEIIDAEIEMRGKLFRQYQERLVEIDGIYSYQSSADLKRNYAYYPIVIDKIAFGMTRDELFKIMKLHHIFPRKYFYPLTNDVFCYQERFSPETTPVAWHLSRGIMTLPLYSDLSEDHVNYICDTIASARRRERA
jgi:dTDP-4-amino-4,6-dideoxygalactose transaminase